MANVQYYDVILKPVVTEKSMAAMGEKKYTFLVHPEEFSFLQHVSMDTGFVFPQVLLKRRNCRCTILRFLCAKFL